MKYPKTESRNAKKARSPKSDAGAQAVRSVLECGDLSPLFPPGGLVRQAAPCGVGARRAGGGSRFAGKWVRGSLLRRVLFDGDKSPCQSGDKSPHSKAWMLGLALLISAFGFPISAFAQSFSLPWHTVDGGGGTSNSGVYSVSGTIGQPDAGGPMTNGQYSLTGGFWALPMLVQTTGAPTLTIAPASPGFATISWTPSTPGFVLQETGSLSPATWTNSPSGNTNPITVPATLPTRFYRLFKP